MQVGGPGPSNTNKGENNHNKTPTYDSIDKMINDLAGDYREMSPKEINKKLKSIREDLDSFNLSQYELGITDEKKRTEARKKIQNKHKELEKRLGNFEIIIRDLTQPGPTLAQSRTIELSSKINNKIEELKGRLVGLKKLPPTQASNAYEAINEEMNTLYEKITSSEEGKRFDDLEALYIEVGKNISTDNEPEYPDWDSEEDAGNANRNDDALQLKDIQNNAIIAERILDDAKSRWSSLTPTERTEILNSAEDKLPRSVVSIYERDEELALKIDGLYKLKENLEEKINNETKVKPRKIERHDASPMRGKAELAAVDGGKSKRSMAMRFAILLLLLVGARTLISNLL